MARPLVAGNAVRLLTAVRPGTFYMRILRRTSDSFIGPTDAGAVTVVDGFAEESLIDAAGLTNGATYYYRCYDWTGTAWIDGGLTLSATPQASWIDDSLDPQELVRARLALGLAAEIARGNLSPQTGKIQVTTAPFALPDGISFPTVSVHLESTGPAERAIGDEIEDFFDVHLNEHVGTEGWLARYSLTIAAVSLNGDERIALRKAIRRIVQANLPVFADAGFVQVDLQQTDAEQFSENNAPLYISNGMFSCIAPAFIRTTGPALTDVTVTETTLNPRTGGPYFDGSS